MEHNVDSRVRSAWNKRRVLSGVIRDNNVPGRLKTRLYTTVIRLTLIYDSDCWAMRRAEQQRRYDNAKMDSWHNKKGRIINEKFRADATGQANHHISPRNDVRDKAR